MWHFVQYFVWKTKLLKKKGKYENHELGYVLYNLALVVFWTIIWRAGIQSFLSLYSQQWKEGQQKQQLGGERSVLLKGIEKVLFRERRLLVYGLTQRQYRQLHSKQDRLASRSSKPSSPDDLPSLTAPSTNLHLPPPSLIHSFSATILELFLVPRICLPHF